MSTAASLTVNTASASNRFGCNRERVRCNGCELRQYSAELCRRCKKPFPKPLVRAVTREVPAPAEADGRLFDRGVTFVSLDELERKAIAHALMQANNAIKAGARRLDMGKTALYEEVAEIFGSEANAIRRTLARARKEAGASTLDMCGYISINEVGASR
jgi:hypothetical protein